MSDDRHGIRVPAFRLPAALTENPAIEAARLAGIEHRERQGTIANAAAVMLTAASATVESLVEEMKMFEGHLGEREELALFVIGGPAGSAFFPTSVQAMDPDKVVFRGIDDIGRPFTVMQHVSQLNFAMQAAPVEENEPPRRIGFHSPSPEA